MVDRADVLPAKPRAACAARRGLGRGAAELRGDAPAAAGRVSTSPATAPAGPGLGRTKAYDLLVQCEAGLVSVTGTPEEPAKAGISVADIAAGMYAFSGVLTALYERERTGRGGCLEVAMLDALGEWMMQPFYYSVYGGRPAQRTGARHASIDPYGPYPAAGGSQVFLGVQNDREWAILCTRILGRPELVTDARFATNTDRVAHRDELTAIISAALAHPGRPGGGAAPGKQPGRLTDNDLDAIISIGPACLAAPRLASPDSAARRDRGAGGGLVGQKIMGSSAAGARDRGRRASLARYALAAGAAAALAGCGGIFRVSQRKLRGERPGGRRQGVSHGVGQGRRDRRDASAAAFTPIVEPFDPGHPAKVSSAPASCAQSSTLAIVSCYEAKAENADAAIDAVQAARYQGGPAAQKAAITADDGAWLAARAPVCAKAFHSGGTIDQVNVATLPDGREHRPAGLTQGRRSPGSGAQGHGQHRSGRPVLVHHARGLPHRHDRHPGRRQRRRDHRLGDHRWR